MLHTCTLKPLDEGITRLFGILTDCGMLEKAERMGIGMTAILSFASPHVKLVGNFGDFIYFTQEVLINYS